MILQNECGMGHYGITRRRCEDHFSSFSRHVVRKCGPLHFAFPGDVADLYTNIQTSGIRRKRKRKKNKNKKVTLHMLTHGTMRGCGLTSWVVCIDDKYCDIRDRNVTIRSEI